MHGRLDRIIASLDTRECNALQFHCVKVAGSTDKFKFELRLNGAVPY